MKPNVVGVAHIQAVESMPCDICGNTIDVGEAYVTPMINDREVTVCEHCIDVWKEDIFQAKELNMPIPISNWVESKETSKPKVCADRNLRKKKPIPKEGTTFIPVMTGSLEFRKKWEGITYEWWRGNDNPLRESLQELYRTKNVPCVYVIPALLAEICLRYHTDNTCGSFLKSKCVQQELHRAIAALDWTATKTSAAQLSNMAHIAQLISIRKVGNWQLVSFDIILKLGKNRTSEVVEGTDPFVRRDIQFICEKLLDSLFDAL